MLKQFSFSFFLIVLLASVQSAFAQEFQEPKSRQVMVKESIANLDSNDIKVAAQAAIHLGMYRAIEAVPKLLQVLQSSRLLQKTEHIIEGNLSSYVSIDVRREIVASLGLIGDKRAVPVLKKYLKRPLRNDEVFTGNVAHALYLITGQSHVYKDYDGVEKIYEASPIAEEEFRKRTRPDLRPTAGLTSSLRIDGHDPSGVYWMGNNRLNISLTITNQSKHPIEIDTSKNNFVFSSVAANGERTDTPVSLLPSPEPNGARRAVIPPGQKLTLMWVTELKDSPLSRRWSEGYVNIKCIYTNPKIHKQGAMWRGERLTSNSVERRYYPALK
ncbi:MAG TPA: HEAT repeat domain-containing protein [Pyrinomonadaceae bacterium]|nr:HEAT repeat domain-containing protein [Pyrinomonadaceae bacterium]